MTPTSATQPTFVATSPLFLQGFQVAATASAPARADAYYSPPTTRSPHLQALTPLAKAAGAIGASTLAGCGEPYVDVNILGISLLLLGATATAGIISTPDGRKAVVQFIKQAASRTGLFLSYLDSLTAPPKDTASLIKLALAGHTIETCILIEKAGEDRATLTELKEKKLLPELYSILTRLLDDGRQVLINKLVDEVAKGNETAISFAGEYLQGREKDSVQQFSMTLAARATTSYNAFNLLAQNRYDTALCSVDIEQHWKAIWGEPEEFSMVPSERSMRAENVLVLLLNVGHEETWNYVVANFYKYQYLIRNLAQNGNKYAIEELAKHKARG